MKKERVLEKSSPGKNVIFCAGKKIEPLPGSILETGKRMQVHILEPDTFALDHYCQRSNISRIDLLTADSAENAISLLEGAPGLLAHGGIDYIQIENGDDPEGIERCRGEISELLHKYRYSLFEEDIADLKHVPTYVNELNSSREGRLLAVNERLLSLTQGRNPEMLPLADLFKAHSLKPRGVIHIGAHEGQELDDYLAMGAEKILFIEANPAVFSRLQENISSCGHARAVCCAVGNENDETILHITSFDQSSSILPLKHTLDVYPDIVETGQVSVTCKRLDSLIEDENLDPSDYNVLCIDIQGAELLALQGATRTLKHIDAINMEVNYEELYSGCALIGESDRYLESFDFRRVATTCPFHPSWGDALYTKDRLITMSTLGFNGRFANQIFQYAFLKLQARKHRLRAETPPWIGQFLFGHDDPPVSGSLPMVVEKRDKINHARPQITNQTCRNVDIWGYFQYHTSFYSPHKEFFRSLFQPSPAVEEKLLPALQRLRGMGRTVIGIHLRRGDYGYGHFFIAPTRWYLDWLEELWPRQDEPVLFLASDEPEKVRRDFSRFNPVTAGDLDCSLPEAEFYPDFYLLSKCDLLAISNSSFSFAASMLNRECRLFMRPHLPAEKLLPYDPWSAEPLLTDATVEGSGMKKTPAQKQEPAPLDLLSACANLEGTGIRYSLKNKKILYSDHKSFHGRPLPGFSRQEKVLGPGPGQMIPGQCGPEMKKEPSNRGYPRSFDVREWLHNSLPGWEPDRFIARIDGSTEALPRNLQGLNCPRILVLGEIHPGEFPVDRMIEYARSEEFDFYLCDQSRLHLRLFHLAGLEKLYWMPGIFHYPPENGMEEEEFENREFSIAYFRNKAIHAGTFDTETQSRGARLLSKLEEDFDNFWHGNLSPGDSIKAYSQAEISLNIGLENN